MGTIKFPFPKNRTLTIEKEDQTMKNYLLTCSKDGENINYVELIERREEEPGFWECYEIAERAGCEFFTLEEFDY